jgi:uncharacterized protein (DUF58 family)
VSVLGPRLRAALLAGRREGRRGVGAAALRRSDGYEFSELREYVEGDDPRRIDWAATARAGNLQTRVILEDRALMLAVALDASLSMHVGRTRSNYDLANDLATFWYGAAIDDDRCARLGDMPFVLRELPGRAAAHACAARRDVAGTSLASGLRLALATLPRGARLLAVSDFFELDSVLPLLRACASRFDVTAFLARDPWHAGMPLGGFVRLRDAESGRLARAYVSRGARSRYVRAVAEREAAVGEALRRTGARVGAVDEDAGPERALARAFAL